MLKIGAIAGGYFGIVFGTGFLLGILRTLLLVPRLGARSAELLEMPLMLTVIVLAARWVSTRPSVAGHSEVAGAVGVVALTFLLVAEVGLGLALRGGSVWAVLTERDPISGTAYYVSLLIFAMLPWALVRYAASGRAQRP